MSLLLAPVRGDEAQAARLSSSLEALAVERGEGLSLTVCEYARAMLHNSLGEYAAGLAAARRAVEPDDLGVSEWALPELIEAAARSEAPDVASEAFERFAERTRAADTTFARGLEARCRALVSDDAVAADAYREALDVLDETSMRLFHARAQLLYGEWLRRANRRVDARVQLETAHEFFDRIGAEGFAGRAARELLATGATPRKRTDDARDQLTAQEAQIAALARDGHTNPEIGAQPKVGASTDAFVAFYDGDRTRILIATVIFGFALLNLMWFGAAIASALRHAGKGGWGNAATAASTAFASVWFVIIAIGATLAYSIGSGGNLLTSGLNDLT